MTRHCLIAAALAALAGCGVESTLELSHHWQGSTFDDPDPSPADPSAPTDPKDDQALNGTSVVLGAPVLNGCDFVTSTSIGSPLPNGCSNNGPLLASPLAWVNLNPVTLSNGAVVNSVALQGTLLTATVNGVQVQGKAFEGARFTGVTTSGSPVQVWLIHAEPGSPHQPDVWRYEFSYQDSMGAWKHLCKSSKRSVVVSGRWDYHQGMPGDAAKIDDPTVFTIGCRRSAIEKCINGGYRPWAAVDGVSLDPYHQACVRMMRADYCGDGVSHTTNGREIDVYDLLGIQVDDKHWMLEAVWSPAGASCLSTLNLSPIDAACLPSLGAKTCGDRSSLGTSSLLVSETPKIGGRDGKVNEGIP